MVTLLEEVVLLTLNPQTGRLGVGDSVVERYALDGAILFDLALARRIDTDEETLTVISDTPTGHPIQDRALAALSREAPVCTVRDCIRKGFYRGGEIDGAVGEVMAQLVEQGIVRQETARRLWVIDVKRLRLVDSELRQSVSDRLARAVVEDEIPEIRDIMLVSLAHACGLLDLVMAREHIERRAERVETLCEIETISRGVGRAIRLLRVERRQF